MQNQIADETPSTLVKSSWFGNFKSRRHADNEISLGQVTH